MRINKLTELRQRIWKCFQIRDGQRFVCCSPVPVINSLVLLDLPSKPFFEALTYPDLRWTDSDFRVIFSLQYVSAIPTACLDTGCSKKKSEKYKAVTASVLRFFIQQIHRIKEKHFKIFFQFLASGLSSSYYFRPEEYF